MKPHCIGAFSAMTLHHTVLELQKEMTHRIYELSVFCLCRELLDKKATQSVANNINYRHRMAQYASRASVNLHTHIFFRNQRRDETGYVLFVRQNAVQVSP